MFRFRHYNTMINKKGANMYNLYVGISLKKDGAVFLISGGWERQARIILDNLQDKMPEEEFLESFKKKLIFFKVKNR